MSNRDTTLNIGVAFIVTWAVAVLCALILTTGCAKLGNNRLDIGPASISGDTLARGAELARPGSGQAVRGAFAASAAAFGKTKEEPFEVASETVIATDATGHVCVQPITITTTRTLKPKVKQIDLMAGVALRDELQGILDDLEANRAASNAVEKVLDSGILDEVPQ